MASLGIILARGASKRLPRKNVLPLLGVPLVAWSCCAARASSIDRVIVSTEDDEIAGIAASHGVDVPFKRPLELAADFARDVDIVLHALDSAQRFFREKYDVVVLIQATTPFVQPEHFDSCLEKLATGKFACVFTARKVEDNPRWTWIEDREGRARPYVGGKLTPQEQHGQNLPQIFYPTGAAWAVRAEALRTQDTIYCEPLGLIETNWRHAVDIDDERDWIVAEAIARHYGIAPVEQSCGRSKQRARLANDRKPTR